jgi:hypothetical protein
VPRAALSVLLALSLVVGAAPSAVATAVRYSAPVDGEVLRGFTAPEHDYGPGHRGVDLAARPGATVRTAAAGEVVFAGSVAGARWVTVRHADGIRTSYGHLDRIVVRVGDDLAGGDAIGTATGRNGDALRPEEGLHWSARRGELYIDPLTLLGADPRPTLVGPGGWTGSALVVQPYAPYEGGSRFHVLAPGSPVVDRQGFARPPNHHHLVQLPGYGTEGPHGVLDAGRLGYGPRDSSLFSYRGCDPDAAGCDPRSYGGTDTDLEVDEAAALLDGHLRALQRAQPGRPVDLLGHSMGGDVATHYLTYHYDPTDPGLPPIGSLITVATPHGGSGLASLAQVVGDDVLIGNVVDVARRGAVLAGAEGADRVRFGSAPLARYGGRGGDRPERDPDRLAELGVSVLEVAASRDLVVGRSDAGSFGPALVLPGGHGSVTEREATYLAVHDHLAGREVTGAGGAAGWATDELADLTRWTGLGLELSPVLGFSRALAAKDAAAALFEIGKEAIGGPNTWQRRHRVPGGRSRVGGRCRGHRGTLPHVRVRAAPSGAGRRTRLPRPAPSLHTPVDGRPRCPRAA